MTQSNIITIPLDVNMKRSNKTRSTGSKVKKTRSTKTRSVNRKARKTRSKKTRSAGAKLRKTRSVKPKARKRVQRGGSLFKPDIEWWSTQMKDQLPKAIAAYKAGIAGRKLSVQV
jgi:hypothetical protein